MGTSSFQQGTLVKMEGKQHTLLRKISDDTWQLEETRTKRIAEYQDKQLQHLYVIGDLTFPPGEAIPTAPAKIEEQPGTFFTNIPPADWEIAKLRRAYVHAALNLENSTDALTSAIHEIWKKLGQDDQPPSNVSVYRWKKRYLAASRDIRSLIPHYRHSGNHSARYPKEVEEFIESAINHDYLTLERGTIQDVLDRASGLVIQENKLRPAALQLPQPTRRLVKRMIDAIPAFDRYAARHGRTAATKRFRAVLAHRTTEAPLQRAEIDHTPLDMMVIDDQTGLPLGRPYLTVCIDDYTRCILGIHISFEPPSYLTVARCLKNAFLPKTDLHAKYPNIKSTWDAHGVMRELVVDNGVEFHCESLENACYSLGIEIHYSARKTAWFKGKVERVQGTFNRGIAHGNPGTTFANIFDKEEYDPSKHAVVSYSTLKEIAHTWVADVYHQKPHRALKAPPAAVWQNSINPEDILLPDDPAVIDRHYGATDDRRNGASLKR